MAKWKDNYEKDRQRSTGMNDRFEQLKLKVVTNQSGQPVGEDAKIAKIRFLTDAKDAESFWVHRLPKQTRLGKRFSVDVYCMAQEGGECNLCNNMNKEISRVNRKLIFWVYVYHILHVNPDKDGKWEKIKYLNQDFYKEVVEDIRLMYQGPGFNNSIETKFLNWEARFGTLCDRDYEWTRAGFGMSDTSYDLIPDPDGKTELSSVIKEAMEGLDTLQAVMDALKPVEGTAEAPDETAAKVEKEVESLFS